LEEFNKLKNILPIGKGMGVDSIQGLIVTRYSKKFQLCGVGEIGEIYMRSHHLSYGYKGKEEETAEKFVLNPLQNDKEDRMYRTGDLGRYLPSGDIVCLGRSDDQVKIRGFRIELGEVNTTLNSNDLVKETVTIVRNDIIEGEKHICSYLVLKDSNHDQESAVSELRVYIKSKLPSYMIPYAIIILKSLPLTPNGINKIKNRKN
jgi:L-2-aminoadipate reductase